MKQKRSQVKAKALELTLSATPCPHGTSTEHQNARNNDPKGSSFPVLTSHDSVTSNTRQKFILKPQRDRPLPYTGKMDFDLERGTKNIGLKLRFHSFPPTRHHEPIKQKQFLSSLSLLINFSKAKK